MPSVRGPKRMAIATTLVASMTAGAVTVHAVVAVAVPGELPPLGAVAVALVAVAAAVALDRAGARPVQVGRQVPQVWGRVLPPGVVAVVYGLRLGIGPLTLLSSWLWWAALVAGATAGVGASVAAALSFAVVKGVALVARGTRSAEAVVPTSAAS